jgi:hypothetical protein
MEYHLTRPHVAEVTEPAEQGTQGGFGRAAAHRRMCRGPPVAPERAPALPSMTVTP